MVSKKLMKRYTTKQLRAMREAGQDQTDWERINSMSEQSLNQAIAEDEDWSDIPQDWYQAAELHMPGQKKQLTLRLDQDVFDWFYNQGKGYQTRMNAALRAFMEASQAKKIDHKSSSNSVR